MSILREKFIVCSDLHSRYTNAYNKEHRLLTLYRAEKQAGVNIHTCGDFEVSTGGIFHTEYWVPFYKVFLDEWAALGGIITAGNHDSGNDFGTINITDGSNTYTPKEYWRLKTGADDNLLIQRTFNDGKDILLSISEKGGTPSAISSDAIATVKSCITGNQDKRVIVFIHYPTWYQVDDTDGTYTKKQDETTTEYSIKKNAFATRYGTGQTGGWSSVGAYPSPTDFLLWLSQQPNVIIFSGHTHNDWRLQEEVLEYTVGDATYTGGQFPNLKYYHVPNGAYMFNIPSMRYRTQDAIVEVYDDQILVKARQGLYTSTQTPVSGAIDALGSDSTWDMYEMGDAYQYIVPMAEVSTADPEPTVYSISVTATGCTVTGASTITEGGTAALTVTASDGYSLPASLTVTGASYAWSAQTGTLTLSSPTAAVFVTVTAVKDAEPEPEPTPSASVPLFTIGGVRITSRDQLWIKTAAGMVHPAHIYDRYGNEITFDGGTVTVEGLTTADGYILMTSDGLIFVPKGA